MKANKRHYITMFKEAEVAQHVVDILNTLWVLEGVTFTTDQDRLSTDHNGSSHNIHAHDPTGGAKLSKDEVSQIYWQALAVATSYNKLVRPV